MPHHFEECDVVDGIDFLSDPAGRGVALPILDRFKCSSSGGLKIVYSGGAVMRSDLEINDTSTTLGTIPSGTIISKTDVIERRVNSCGVVRYRVKFKDLEGYISGNIRGGSEEAIVELIDDEGKGEEEDQEEKASYPTPHDCSKKWIEDWRNAGGEEEQDTKEIVRNFEDFKELVDGVFVPGLSTSEFDHLLSKFVSVISNFTKSGDALECQFSDVSSALSFALGKYEDVADGGDSPSSAAINQAAAAVFVNIPSDVSLPSVKAVLTRVAVIRAMNRRARYAFPWLPVRPFQEVSLLSLFQQQ